MLGAPKAIIHSGHAGPLEYAYHFDAVELAKLLRPHATALGVHHVEDLVHDVALDERGYIQSLGTRAHGDLTADPYIDCTGFRAQLIGRALGSPYHSFRDWVFANRAVALHVPLDRPDAPIESLTISTAQEAGWTWDIGLAGAGSATSIRPTIRRTSAPSRSSAPMLDPRRSRITTDLSRLAPRRHS
jgi:tryptophan halogenase